MSAADHLPVPRVSGREELEYVGRPRPKPFFRTVVHASDVFAERGRTIVRTRASSEEGGRLHVEAEHFLRRGRLVERCTLSTAEKLRTLELTRTVEDHAGDTVRTETIDFRRGPVLVPDTAYPEVLLPFLMSGQPFDDKRRSLYAWINDRFVAKVYYQVHKRSVAIEAPIGRVVAHEVVMYPDLNDWIPLGAMLTTLAKPFLPKYHMWFDERPPHRLVRFEGPYGPPGAPEVLLELAAVSSLRPASKHVASSMGLGEHFPTRSRRMPAMKTSRVAGCLVLFAAIGCGASSGGDEPAAGGEIAGASGASGANASSGAGGTSESGKAGASGTAGSTSAGAAGATAGAGGSSTAGGGTSASGAGGASGGTAGAGASGANAGATAAGQGGVTLAPPFPSGSGEASRLPDYPPPPYGIGVGSTIADLSFVGFPSSANTQAPLPIALSDFYNPTGDGVHPAGSPYGAGNPKPIVLHIDICSAWCAPCNQFAQNALPSELSTYAPHGLAVLTILFDGGVPGVPATLTQLKSWDAKYPSTQPSALDREQRLMDYLSVEAYPAGIFVDTRTMTILDETSGALDSMQLATRLDPWLGLGGAGGAGGGGSAGASSGGTAGSSGSSGATSQGGQAGTPGGMDPSCWGGVIVAGVCEGKCEPSSCVADNTCVGNACRLVCASHAECAVDGSEDCAAATEDDTGASIRVCTANGRAAGIGLPCPLGNECDGHMACPDGSPCDASTPCASGTCAALACKGLVDDAAAFCSRDDCTDDAACPGGMYCGKLRDPHVICGSTPNTAACGKTSDPCLDGSVLAQSGATYFKASPCLLRSACVVRDGCAPCTTDLDCSRIAGQRCVTLSDGGYCVAGCASDADCTLDAACQSGACVPKAGACHGDGSLCAPCHDDFDCPGAECRTLHRGQRACVPPMPGAPCTTDADCPTLPSGLSGTCLDEASNVPMGAPQYHTCAAHYDPVAAAFTCW